jgi:alpha-L-rhamnosidase
MKEQICIKNEREWHILVVIFIVFIGILTNLTANSAILPTNLRCEYLTDPYGIDVVKPRLSWCILSSTRGQLQTAYQVLVASSEEKLERNIGDLWDSEKILSDQSVQILYSGKQLTSGMRCYWKIRVWDKDGKQPPWSQSAFWTMGLLSADDWKGSWIGARPGSPTGKRQPFRDGKREEAGAIDPADAPAILLRRQVQFSKRPVRTTAYISGLGYYELYINGIRVGDHRLDPSFTDYTRRVLYATYDVSKFIRQGENILGVMLGNGFYCLQTPDLFQLEKAPWRTPPRMILNLVVEYADGSTSAIVSDKKWKWSTGEIRFNCIRGGETIDAGKDPGPWLEQGYNDSAWEPALEVSPPLGGLSSQLISPIRIDGQYKPVRITEPKPGVYVADFGRNLAGWVKWTTSGLKGQRVTMDFNEALNEDGTLDVKANGSHTYGRYQHQECILSGADRDVFEPHFTYHAFRYVEFRGLSKAPLTEDITAIRLHTELMHTGSFECSDQRLNQLHNAARRTLEDCTWSGPAAEPVREKVNWLGDDTFCQDAYFYLFDCSQLYRKHIIDMIDAQEPNGHIGPVIPTGGWGDQGDGNISQLHYCDSPWWSIGLALGVQRLRTDYNDKETTALAYESVRRYTDFLTSTSRDGIVNWGLWDWLPRVGSIETKSDFTSTAAYYYQAKLVASQAALLGKQSDAEKYNALAQSIKLAFNQRFYNFETGRYALGSQTAQSLPLFLDMVPEGEREQVIKNLVEIVKTAGNKLETGFIGTMPAFYSLTDAGYGDIVLEMLKEGWFHMLGNGDASTLGESPYTRYGGYGSGHHQFGACVAGWLYRCLAGIRSDPEGSGYKKFVIKPAIIGDLTWVKANYESVYGQISSRWERERDNLTITVSVPPNTMAVIYVPVKEGASIFESGKLISKTKGVRFLRIEKNTRVFELSSGSYRFQSTLPEKLR